MRFYFIVGALGSLNAGRSDEGWREDMRPSQGGCSVCKICSCNAKWEVYTVISLKMLSGEYFFMHLNATQVQFHKKKCVAMRNEELTKKSDRRHCCIIQTLFVEGD